MDGTLPDGYELGPFFPAPTACGPLLERAAALVAEGHRLEAASGALTVALRPLVRIMNAAYASELEGRPVRAADIERVIPDVDLDDPGARTHQLARAHVAAEAALMAALPTKRVGLFAPEFVQCIHAELHRARSRGRAGAMEHESRAGPAPGSWRVGPAPRSEAAPAENIPELLDEWQGVYSKPFAPDRAIVAALCSHHRLLSVRPFEHGNGRTARLHTQLLLSALGVTAQLWSPVRGMARDRDGYHARLGQALAGREALAEGEVAADRDEALREALEEFAAWGLDLCLDEARTARALLDVDQLKRRLEELLAWLAARPWVMGSERSVIKPDALEALHYVAITGPVERARFIAMLGLQHRTGRRVLSSLIDFGLLVSESSRAPVRFALPLASLRFLFPGVWPVAIDSEEPRSATPWGTPSEVRDAEEPAEVLPAEGPAGTMRATEARGAEVRGAEVLPPVIEPHPAVV